VNFDAEFSFLDGKGTRDLSLGQISDQTARSMIN
jgi:hypothetical protein